MNYIYAFVYVILTAVSMVLIHDAGSILSPALNLFLSTLIAIIFFHALNVHHIKKMYITAFSQKGLWIKMMLMIACIWISTIYGPVYVDPSIFILNYFSCLCILGIVFTFKKNPDIFLALSGIGVTISTILLNTHFIPESTLTSKMILGICLGLSGGIAAFFYSKYSHDFSKNTDFSVSQVLAVRFWLVELACIPLLPASSLSFLTTDTILLIITISFVSLIFPIYFYMKSIFIIGPEKNSIICGLIPAATYLLQVINGDQLHLTIFFLNVITGFFIGLPYIVKLIKQH